MRFDDRLNIKFCIDGELQERSILPLVMISLVENALKHGDISDSEFPLIIHLCINPERMLFFIKNKKANTKKASQQLGIDNLKRRLEIGYGRNHDFIIENADSFYSSKLVIYEQ